VFYFFQKGSTYLRCEILAGQTGFELVVTEPSGNERREPFATAQDAQRRWEHLQQELKDENWLGPFGRE
jgi:hypothetical protein